MVCERLHEWREDARPCRHRGPFGCYPLVELYFDSRWRSAALCMRAFAAAFDALIALARRSSGLSFSARAWPPMRPRALIASDTRLILRLLVMYFFGVFVVMWTYYSVRYGEATINTHVLVIFC
jgi:hypothetical protein